MQKDKRMFTIVMRSRDLIVKLSKVMVFAMVFAGTACTADPKDMEPINIIFAFDEKGRRIGISDETAFPFEDCKRVANEFARMKTDVKFKLSHVAKGRKVSLYAMECRKHRSILIDDEKYRYYVNWQVNNGPVLD